MVKRGQRNIKAHCNLMVPIIALGQKEVNLVYNVKREQEGGLIKILVPKRILSLYFIENPLPTMCGVSQGV